MGQGDLGAAALPLAADKHGFQPRGGVRTATHAHPSLKALLVEDDPDLLDLTGYSLRREGFSIVEATDGLEAVQRWRAESPDIVVLDLGLPRQDGFEVLRKIRADSQTPVIVLTGRSRDEEILRCFSLGADDYVTKPFSQKQLTMRIRAVLRRVASVEPDHTLPPLTIGDLRLDQQFHEVSRSGRIVDLTPIEFKIVYMLAVNFGRVVTFNRIFAYVWGHQGGDTNALRSHVSHIRHKLQLPPGAIVSMPTVGYQLKVDLLAHDSDKRTAGRSLQR
jgi:two-component system OmpR family response regulator